MSRDFHKISYRLFWDLGRDLRTLLDQPMYHQILDLADKYQIPPELVHYINTYYEHLFHYFLESKPIYTAIDEDCPEDDVRPHPPALYLHPETLSQISLEDVKTRVPQRSRRRRGLA